MDELKSKILNTGVVVDYYYLAASDDEQLILAIDWIIYVVWKKEGNYYYPLEIFNPKDFTPKEAVDIFNNNITAYQQMTLSEQYKQLWQQVGKYKEQYLYYDYPYTEDFFEVSGLMGICPNEKYNINKDKDQEKVNKFLQTINLVNNPAQNKEDTPKTQLTPDGVRR